MKPDIRFASQPKAFWAYVRSISQGVGYTYKKRVRVPTSAEVFKCLSGLRLATDPVVSPDGNFTDFGRSLEEYFRHRAQVLNTEVEPALMTAEEAALLYATVRQELKSVLVVPMNKQKGDKRKEAYLTGLVSMLIEANRARYDCDFDPRVLTAFTKGGVPVRTLSRRMDGAFPAAINPVAIWEIKEYYYTTSFGSRIADGVYETQLDGLELEEMKLSEELSVKHYLFLDARYTWWDCGKSYLCRIFDMVNMGLVDEVIVGRNVATRVPELVREWISVLDTHAQAQDSPKVPLPFAAGEDGEEE